jgi:hypothetical protein
MNSEVIENNQIENHEQSPFSTPEKIEKRNHSNIRSENNEPTSPLAFGDDSDQDLQQEAGIDTRNPKAKNQRWIERKAVNKSFNMKERIKWEAKA